MKLTTASTYLSLLFFCISTTRADSFGTGANTFDIEFVSIGDANNPDDTGFSARLLGKVDYFYRMGRFEISEGVIDNANALGGLGITHDKYGTNKPATSISWYEAARFVNWLNTSKGHIPAYKFVGENFHPWRHGDDGYNPNNKFRNSLAMYFLPSADEWHKAAYFDPNTNAYYDYPTGSNSVPDGIDFTGDTAFDAVFNDGGFNVLPNDISDAGTQSPYGTVGQGGNVLEWEETDIDLVNDVVFSERGVRGGHSRSPPSDLNSRIRPRSRPGTEASTIGFRVASIPEPSSSTLVLSILCLPLRSFRKLEKAPVNGSVSSSHAPV